MTYIYAYTKDNKAYVGKTINLKQRKVDHKRRFDGWDYQVIDSIDSFNKSQWKPLESCWITAYEEGGYEMVNKNRGGGGQEKASEETKAKLSAAAKGKPKSEEHKANMCKPKSEEHVAKVIAAKRGKPNPKIAVALKGRVISEEWKAKISTTKRGKPNPKVAAALKGRVISEETKAKMSASITKWWAEQKLRKGI